MIQIELHPSTLVAHLDNLVRVSVRNTGTEDCRRIFIRLVFPVDLVLTSGRARLEIAKLAAGERQDSTLSVRPRRAGRWKISSHNSSYRDAADLSRRDVRLERELVAAEGPAAPAERLPTGQQRCGVFVCYRRTDAQRQAEIIYDEIIKCLPHGSRAFRDLDTIEPGKPFQQVIDEHLACACVVLVLIGRRWLKAADDSGRRRLDLPDDPVRLEIETALSGAVMTVPVLCGHVRMPTKEQLPSAIARLASRQSFSVDGGEDARRLASYVCEKVRLHLGQ